MFSFARYNPSDYELVRRVLKASPRGYHPPGFSVPNRKTDWKMCEYVTESILRLCGSICCLLNLLSVGVFGEFPGAQWEYPNATWERQQEIVQEFKQRALGLLHFFMVDPAVPSKVRLEMSKYGLCKDEYNRSDHWMPQLYVRTALRMVRESCFWLDCLNDCCNR